MPTHPRSYSPAAAEKLRRALLALAASAATVTASAQDTDGSEFNDPDVLGEIPEDIMLDGDWGSFLPCEKKDCPSVDCFCESDCTEDRPCTNCSTPSSSEEKTHAENAEGAKTKPHAESAEPKPQPKSAETVAPLVGGLYPIQVVNTNAPAASEQREAGSVPEASASGPASAPPDRIRIRGRLRPEP